MVVVVVVVVLLASNGSWFGVERNERLRDVGGESEGL